MTTATLDTFTMPASHAYGKPRDSVIGRALAEELADLFTAAGINSPFSKESGRTVDGRYESGPASWSKVPAIAAKVAGLPAYWDLDVAFVLGKRREAQALAARVATYEAVENATIRAFLLSLDPNGLGMVKAEPIDLTWMIALSRRDNMANGKPVYQPEPGCKASMKLSAAVHYNYTQEAYADHSRYAVPVELDAAAELTICKRNLQAFCRALRTHNGLAGSGSEWSADLHVGDDGAFVIFDCRASISD